MYYIDTEVWDPDTTGACIIKHTRASHILKHDINIIIIRDNPNNDKLSNFTE